MNAVITAVFFCLIMALRSVGFSQDLPLAEYDTKAKVFSIGDIHGDLGALKKVLYSLGLYSTNNQAWVGGNSHLVFTGDLIDRGPDSKAVMDFIMELEVKASVQGGQVHTLLGNHELIVSEGITRYAHKKDFESFQEYTGLKGKNSFLEAFQSDSKYAKWFRSRNSIIRINDTLFVHAGIEPVIAEHSLVEINIMVRNWLKFFQGVGERPASATRWVIEDKGPLWTRTFAPLEKNEHMSDEFFEFLKSKEYAKVPLLDKVLNHFGVRRVAVGHSIVDSMKISVDHPVFGDRVVMTDTGISVAYGKLVSGFQYTSEGVTGFQFDRGTGGVIQRLKSIARLSCRQVYQ